MHQISQFVTLSLTALEHNDTLYGNIAYSLSNTLCSNDNHSSATVAVHLAKLIEWLNQTEDKLKSLSRDWGACLDAEDKAWAQLSNYPNPTPHVTDLGNSFGTKESAAFRKEAEEIFEAKSQTIEDIEEVRDLRPVPERKYDANTPKEYKDQVHAETANILEHMVE